MRARTALGTIVLAATPFLGGCASASKTAQGAGLGAALGAGTGAIIGGATNGKAGKGALIGAAAGGVLGGLVGNEEDRRDREALEQRARDAESRSTVGSPVGLSDVVQLTKDGVGEEVIINQIRTTGATFQLSTEDLRTLQANNVSPNVIKEMQNRRPGQVMQPRHLPPHSPPPTRVIYAPPPPPEVIVVPAPPPPPPSFGVGVHIRR